VLDGTLTGVIAGDGITAIYSTSAVQGSPVSTYPISATLNDPNSRLYNYIVTYTNGVLTITPPLPQPLSLSPASATMGGTGFTLVVNGANFQTNLVVLWNGAVRATTYVSSTQLTASILASDIAAEGMKLVTVASCNTQCGSALLAPPPSGPAFEVTSSAMPFAVVASQPVAKISGSSVSDAADASGNHVLTLDGTDFVSGSTIAWKGASLITNYVSPWQLSAEITAADYATLPAMVTVVNPAGSSTEFELP
jgi:hypothetical protein